MQAHHRPVGDSETSVQDGVRKQTHLEIAGLPVLFPFEPYSCQVAFMEAAIRAVQRGENALLESPTGTGKTLCLLCSSLAWLENEKRRGGSAPQPALSGSIPPKKEHGESAESVARALVDKNSTEARISMPSRRVPTIFYASRTHSQLSQVVKEVRSSAYAHSTTVAVLGSRQQLCVHEQVSNLPTNSAINHACNELTQTRPARCHFRNAVPDNGSLGLAPSSVSSSSTYSQNSAPSSLRPSSASSLGGWGAARDIEELVELGKQDAVCPYFLSRNVVPEANLVLLPYNYLLDPPTRESLKVIWMAYLPSFECS
jgi:regulator of telomere elongation helicase 1